MSGESDRPTFATWNELLLHTWQDRTDPAIADDDGVVTGTELLGLAGGASALLDDAGFVAGDVVPALIDESRAAIALVLGGALSRRPLAPLGTKLPVADLAAALAATGARHLLAEPERSDLAAEVAGVAGVGVIVIDGPPPPGPLPTVRCGPDDTAVVVHTSGTTGLPKPVYVRQRPLVERVERYRRVLGIGPGDRYCSASPFYHTAGVAMDVTVLGIGAAIVPQDWFSVDNWRRAGRLGVTCALLVPTMIEMLLAEGALADAEPEVLQYGAMPIHPDTLRAAMAALPRTRFLQIFGQTEVSPITYLDHSDHLRAIAGETDLLRSVGRAIHGSELRVEGADADGIGELAIRAAHAFQADADGWRRTGDLGTIAADGYVTLHGRVGDRIIRGGENIYPGEIELALLEHPDVAEAAVVGVPDRRWGEVVKAVMVVSPGHAHPAVDELRAFVADRVAHFKVPAVFDFVEALPRTASGKVKRRELANVSVGEGT